MATTANAATQQARTAANIAIQAAESAQVSASQAAIAANRGSNVTNITINNPNAAGITGALQFASSSNQLTASRNLIFDQAISNLQLEGNLNVSQLISAQTMQLQSATLTGTMQAESLVAARIESLANISAANRITANVILANIFVGDGSNLTGILKQNDATLIGNVSIPDVSIDGPSTAPVPLGLLNTVLQSKANIDSPAFTGNPTAPTLSNIFNSSNSIATTEFVQLVVNTKANVSNVTLTNISLVGDVFAPTLLANTSNSTVATTQFVQDQKINLNLSGIPTAPIPNVDAVANQIATVSFARSSSSPAVIMSRRTGDAVSITNSGWVTIPFDTFDRNTINVTFVGNNFDLPAGTYVYNISMPVYKDFSDAGNGLPFFTRFLNVDTGFALQNIAAVSIGDLSSTTINGTGEFTLSGTTTIALQGFQNSAGNVIINGYSGYQSGIIQFWKVA